MANDPNEVGEQGWVIDPQNPNRATYTDIDGTVMEAFKPEAPAEPTERGAWQRLKDSTVEASQYGFPGLVARKWYDWTDTGVQDLIKQGHSPEEAEAIADTMIGEAQKGLRAEMAAKQEADPNWKADESFWENAGAIDRWGPWLAGQLVGSAGPESAIPMGKFAQYGAKTAAAARTGLAAGVNAVTGALYQGLDMIDEARDEFSVEEMLSDAAIGAGFQGAFEVPGFIKNMFKNRGADTTPGENLGARPAPLEDTRMSAADEAGWTEVLQTGTFDEISDYRDRMKETYGFNVASSDIAAWVNGRNKAAEAGQELDAYAVYQDAQTGGEVGPQQTASVAPTFQPTSETRAKQADIAVEHINTITKDWKNSPEYTVHDNFDELEGVDNDAIGVFRDGKVEINLRQVMEEAEAAGMSADDMLSSVTFHEGLGHHGLVQKFGDELDLTMNKLYDSSPEFQKQVDEWMAANPDAYANDMDPLARAAEEVFAEMSEAGRIKPNVMALLRNRFKEFGREMGLDLKYTDGEIKTILGMAHNATVNGKGRDVIGNGFRYMATAYHGSAADFDEFDHSYMGSGEGAQVYGWGTYLTDTQQIAEGYKRTLSDGRFEFDNDRGGKVQIPKHYQHRQIDDALDLPINDAARTYPVYYAVDEMKRGASLDKAIETAYRDYAHYGDQEGVSWGLEKLRKSNPRALSSGKLYEVELPDNAIWMRWDDTLDEQPDLKQALDGLGVQVLDYDDYSFLERQESNARLEYDEISEDLKVVQSELDALEYQIGVADPNQPNFVALLEEERAAEEAATELYNKVLIASAKLQKAKDAFPKGTIHDSMSGETVYARLVEKYGSPKDASLALNSVGIEGNKFRDGMSRYKNPEEERKALTEEWLQTKEDLQHDIDVETRYLEEARSKGDVEAVRAQEEDIHFRKQELLAEQRNYEKKLAKIKDISYNYVAFNDKTPKIVNKYMRPTRGKRNTPDVEEKAPTRRIGGVNLNNIEGIEDIEYLLEEAQARSGGPTSSVPRGQTVLSGKALGLTPTKAMKDKYDETGLAARIDAGAQLLVNQLGRIQSLLDRANNQGDAGSAKTHVQIAKEMATLSAIYGRVSGNNSEVGRALNILNRVRDVTKSADDLLKYMQSAGNKVYSDPNMLTQLSKMMKDRLDAGDTAGAAKLARASFKPKAEDYIFRLWFNMMLSSPATHAANFLGTGGNFIMDLMENTGAAVVGQGKRFSNVERVRGREVAYRVWGALRALTTADTWSKTRESFSTGLTGNMPNLKAGETESNVYTGKDPALGFMSGLLEAPTRALAGTDEWWRNVLQMSNMYGLAVRNAGNKGLKGREFWDEVDNLIGNPTKEMIEATNDYTRVIQFLDKPSAIAETIINAQSPKPNSTVPGRIARGTLKFFIPFVRTPDALIRTAIRRSGPLGALERENINNWKKGGAERDKVIARMYMGSMLSFWVAAQAYKGAITGAGPSDYDKKMEWLGSRQENSIKVGDEYVSISGLEPVSTNLTAIATLVERYKAGELTDEDYGKSAISAAQGLASVLTENSYLEGLQNLVQISSADPGKAQSGLTNFLAGLASSATTPAILRKQVQSEDPAMRDTTGDGSFGDRVEGRIKSGAPGMADDLPQRYDVYGRPMTRDIAGPDMLTRANTKDVDDDPAILELKRLADSTEKVVVGPPSKSNIKVNGVARRLTAEEFQDYQHLSGYWIVESLRQEMQTPEWEAMTDEEKLEVVADIKNDMRKTAREYLFNSEEEEESVSDE